MPTPSRRWYRWRWLPLLVGLLGVGGGWFALKWKPQSNLENPPNPRIILSGDDDGELTSYDQQIAK